MTTRILVGDAFATLKTLPSASVHCIVTSPPYFGLRDYQTAQWNGGDPDCEHRNRDLVSNKSGLRNDGRKHVGPYNGEKTITTGMPFRDRCGHCGAIRIDSQIGLEPSPEAYVQTLVAVFREARRVLRDDGTLWLNLGDSYNANQGSGFDTNRDGGIRKALAASPKVFSGLPPKNLLMMPARVALALQSDGWYLRSDIIWAKPNPMPESVTDRPTNAHEHIFLLAKSPRYFYDAEAVKEERTSRHDAASFRGGCYVNGEIDNGTLGKRKTFGDKSVDEASGRNLRNVWTVATQPYSEAHFATFPPALIEPCIKAGCPVGGTVLDPFGGAGTTGLVADRLGRDCILIELNAGYAALARQRIEMDGGLFASVIA